MALASEVDVENALGRPLTSSEDVLTLLESASDLVMAEIKVIPDSALYPEAEGVIARVVGEMVAEVLRKPAVTTSDYAATGYNVQRETAVVRVGVEPATTGGPWLSKSQRIRLSPYIKSSRKAFVVDTDNDTDPPDWMTAGDGVDD